MARNRGGHRRPPKQTKMSFKDKATLLVSILALFVSGWTFYNAQKKESYENEVKKVKEFKSKYSAFLLGRQIVEAVQQKNTAFFGGGGARFESQALVALVNAQATAKNLEINFDLPTWIKAIYDTKDLEMLERYDAEIDLRRRLSEQIRTKYSIEYEYAFSIGATLQ